MNISVSFLSLGHFYVQSYGFKADIINNEKDSFMQSLNRLKN